MKKILEISEKNELIFGTGYNNSDVAGISSVAICADGDDAPIFMSQRKCEKNEHGAKVLFFDECGVWKVELSAEIFEGVRVIRQDTVVHCASGEHTLTQAAADVHGICCGKNGMAHRLGDGSILVHFCINRWQGEGQWRCVKPEDLGVYAATTHPWEKSWCRFDSVSSWSTATYYPLFILEDVSAKKCWFFEIEGGSSWFFELYGYGGEKMNSLSVKFGGADEKLGFVKKMHEGDTYSGSTCVYGVTDGGFEEAVRELIAYKRKTSLAIGKAAPVFNDYMNCNWANESRAALLPLIDKAAELGVETFCIDDGWQIAQGIWYPADEKFRDKNSTGDLKEIFDYISAKGMKVGVWFEFETVPLKVAEMLGANDCFLFRNDSLVAHKRPLANMRSKNLLAYLNERADALYDMGVRFIKNDHNNTEYLGTTLYGESAAEGLENNARAFLDFIDGLIRRHPDLTIENCASGAMRSDHGTLKHFHLQSTSDQENYLAYPSILAGSLAQMPPEKAGIWCYPYPLCFGDRGNTELSSAQAKTYADGEQTVFNVVNSFLGSMYISGKIHQADDYNFSLLKEGVALYKKYAPFIGKSYPVFPRGTVRLSERSDYAAGLIGEDGSEMLLAMWNLSNEARNVSVDLRKYGMKICTILYPVRKSGCAFSYENEALRCEFELGRSARLFLLKK